MVKKIFCLNILLFLGLMIMLGNARAANPDSPVEEAKEVMKQVLEDVAEDLKKEEPAGEVSFSDGFVAVVEMDMMILPGTQYYLEKSIEKASREGAKLIIVLLDTPGGVLNTSQEMIQAVFKSPVPVAIFVSPSGSTATSAGVFITMAGHVAAMAPGTSIGAAHPVAGDGKDIEGDMRQKAENMTVAMVKSISDERGRNVEWAEKSVKESSSLTEKEALEKKVIDYIAEDITSLLKQIKGREVKVGTKKIKLGDYTTLPRKYYEIGFKEKLLNVLANPNIAALLWLGATTGISLELYNPGAIIPGMVGVICLLLALAVSQIIPVTQSGILLLILGALLIGAEMYVASGVLGVGGVIALIFGTLYLVDVGQAPGLSVSFEFVIPMAVMVGGFALWTVHAVVKSYRHQSSTGGEGIIGLTGKVVETIDGEGRVFVRSEYWKAVPGEGSTGPIEKDSKIEVVGKKSGLVLEVKKID